MLPQEDHLNTVQALNVDSLKVDLVVIQNTCFEKEDSNSETAFNKPIKESSMNSETKDVHAIKYKMSKAKERCMAYFLSLHSHLQVLSKEDLKGTHIEHVFKRAFMSLFGQHDDTFTSMMFLNVDQLQKKIDKDEFQEYVSMAAFWVKQERQIDTGKAVDADLVITESSGTESKVQDDNIRTALELKYQNKALKLKQHGQIVNETSNKAKIKNKIDAYEIINIELELSVAKLLTEIEHLNAENETVNKHYKDLYDSIKITRSETIEQTTSLLANNVDLKAHIQEKVFTFLL
uniref:Uncharacterized protein n=1 Tax=Tanacetum cinerariifolium TaxID=118510 RepID=A0A699J2F5_TANCI|nr:hypothetical protein [Tanacetum cinerariifolium]